MYIVDPYFSRALSLHLQDSLLFGEKFGCRKVGVATYFLLF